MATATAPSRLAAADALSVEGSRGPQEQQGIQELQEQQGKQGCAAPERSSEVSSEATPKTSPEASSEVSGSGGGVLAAEDLAEVIRAYSAVADRLQASHEALSGEVVRLQEELVAKNAQLERSKRLSALGEMAAGIAHEIRNPLAAIQLYVEMVGDDLEDTIPGVAAWGAAGEVHESKLSTAADNNRKIAGAVRGLSAIVNDVLSFARQIEPRVQRLEAEAVLRRVVESHRPAIDAACVEVDFQCDAAVIEADAELLHQALLNLVRNAVDAMAERGGGQLSLVVGAGRVTVSDTGPGLPKGVADRIFNPFFTTRNTGTGLGLAIVHRIVDAHGGTIAVHNHAEHGGAVFTLELPVAKGAAEAGLGVEFVEIGRGDVGVSPLETPLESAV